MQVEESLRPFWRNNTGGRVCAMGNLVVVLEVLHERLLIELHHDHPGMSRMKTVTRAYMRWPRLDSDVEV